MLEADPPQRLTEEQIEEAMRYGGAEDYFEYERRDQRPGCDQDHHKARSTYHQPNHSKHQPKDTSK